MEPLPLTADVVIVGGGSIGLSTAYALGLRGVSSVVLERGQIGVGASSGTACMVTPSHADRMASPTSLREGLRHLFDAEAPLKLRGRPSELAWIARFTAASARGNAADSGTAHLRFMARRSLELHRAWNDALKTGLVEEGTLNVWTGPNAHEDRAAIVADQRAAGMTLIELDAAAVAELEPSVRNVTVGALCTDDGHVDSLGFIQAVAAGARSVGAEICENVELMRIDRSGVDLRIETTRGVMTCGHLVLAAGVWSRHFADDVGSAIPLTAAKGYHVDYAGANSEGKRPIYLSDEHVVGTPLAGRLRLAGTMEIGTDPDLIDVRRVNAIRRAGEHHFEGITGTEPAAIWKGLRPLSADSMPLIGPSPSDRRITIATGHGMLGITLGPVSGELAADCVTGAATAPDPLLDPARFR
jgi:D-amino-acid dehydrogenase